MYTKGMRSIPLNLLTLYADIQQRLAALDTYPASIARKKIKGRYHLYAIVKDGAKQRQHYLGPADSADVSAQAERHKRAWKQRAELKQSVQALRRAGIAGPDIVMGRLFECFTHAGLFEHGAVLVGTAAYLLYPCIVGSYLSMAAGRTEDADLAAARLSLKRDTVTEPLLTILRRADASYEPSFSRISKLPIRFVSQQGFIVELLTTKGRSDAPLEIPKLGCAAHALPYLEYLIENPIPAVALYGPGIPVMIPEPARYAVHKLILHQIRQDHVKRVKDLMQAKELIAILRQQNPDALQDAIDNAEIRGRNWKSLIRNGLKIIER